ncbi:hypothetical protein E2C01_093772 [Portunus trituberculatus]|uniref:Uncharacterized protein n=1 Tax=Portunus trituberculatus TaxID=210409 RepID=A0A5B7JVC9_PORTR|nr:hypothetical protein [Portunus trituberculatus]
MITSLSYRVYFPVPCPESPRHPALATPPLRQLHAPAATRLTRHTISRWILASGARGHLHLLDGWVSVLPRLNADLVTIIFNPILTSIAPIDNITQSCIFFLHYGL